MKATFFIALQEEMSHAYATLAEAGGHCSRKYDSRLSNSYTFVFSQTHGSDLAITLKFVGGMGNLKVALSVLPHLIERRPFLAILIGIAGSLSPDEAELCDVIISSSSKMISPDKIRELDSDHAVGDLASVSSLDEHIFVDERKTIGKKSFFRFKREVEMRDNDDDNLELYLSHRRQAPLALESPKNEDEVELLPKAPKIRTATILGSEYVVDSEEYISFLRDRNHDLENDYYFQRDPTEAAARNNWSNSDLVAVDMETFGFFRAISTYASPDRQIIAFSVRGISDHSSNKETMDEDSSKVFRSVAARNATSVAIDLFFYLINELKVSR